MCPLLNPNAICAFPLDLFSTVRLCCRWPRRPNRISRVIAGLVERCGRWEEHFSSTEKLIQTNCNVQVVTQVAFHNMFMKDNFALIQGSPLRIVNAYKYLSNIFLVSVVTIVKITPIYILACNMYSVSEKRYFCCTDAFICMKS